MQPCRRHVGLTMVEQDEGIVDGGPNEGWEFVLLHYWTQRAASRWEVPSRQATGESVGRNQDSASHMEK